MKLAPLETLPSANGSYIELYNEAVSQRILLQPEHVVPLQHTLRDLNNTVLRGERTARHVDGSAATILTCAEIELCHECGEDGGPAVEVFYLEGPDDDNDDWRYCTNCLNTFIDEINAFTDGHEAMLLGPTI